MGCESARVGETGYEGKENGSSEMRSFWGFRGVFWEDEWVEVRVKEC